MLCVCICINVYVHMCVDTYRVCLSWYIYCMCPFVCMHVFIYTHVNIFGLYHLVTYYFTIVLLLMFCSCFYLCFFYLFLLSCESLWYMFWKVLYKIDKLCLIQLVPHRITQNCPRRYSLPVFDHDGDQVRCRFGASTASECSLCYQPDGFSLDQVRNTFHNHYIYRHI